MWRQRVVALFEDTMMRRLAEQPAAGVLAALRKLIVFGVVVLAFAPAPAAALLAPTTTTITASANPVSQGSSVTFTVAVSSGSGTPDGTVIFLGDLLSLGVATLDGTGRATFTTATLPVGLHAIIAVYVGNLNFATSTSSGLSVNVTPAACTVAVATSANPVILGTPVDLTATISASGATPTGNVTFKSGASVLGTVTLGGGAPAVLSVSTLGVGSPAITAEYGGDANFLPCIAPVITVTVNKRPTMSAVISSSNPSALGAPVTYAATVSGPAGIPTGSVTFKDGVTVVGTGALNGSGLATLVTGSIGAGTHAITAVYAGDANFVGSTSSSLTHTVNQGNSAVALTSSASPAVAGTPVTFTATITGTGATPSGTVTFRDGSTTIGTASLNAGGQATLVTSALTLGAHAITAIYGGDTNLNGSSSAALAQAAVSTASTTALTVTPNPAAAGAVVSFVAAVTGKGGTPTGSVTFKDGTMTLSTVPLDGTGRATMLSNSLAGGGHSISAAYGGDATFASSASAVATLQIATGARIASTTTVSATSNPSAPGVAVTFNASVAATAGMPTGTVTFKTGAQTIGTATLDGGLASLTLSSMAVGMHLVTATYDGDASFASSISAAMLQSISVPPESLKSAQQVVAARPAAQTTTPAAVAVAAIDTPQPGGLSVDHRMVPGQMGMRPSSPGQAAASVYASPPMPGSAGRAPGEVSVMAEAGPGPAATAEPPEPNRNFTSWSLRARSAGPF